MNREPAKHGKERKLRHFTVRTLAANVVTTLALSAGMTAVRFALEQRFELAVVFVIAASVLDALDGAVARLLKSTSRFGAELDSLSDVIAFGVAPAFLIYSWGLVEMERAGWIVSLAFGVACALRLARYNARLEVEDDDPSRSLGFFTGVPAPAGAGLVLLPMLLLMGTGSTAKGITRCTRLFRKRSLCVSQGSVERSLSSVLR